MHKNLKTAAELLVVGVCTVALAFTVAGITAHVLTPNSGGQTDFVEYWASGRLLVQHQDPYSAALLLPLERSVHYPKELSAQVMGNPPWSLPLVAPLGFLDINLGKILWFLLSLLCLIGSVRLIWIMCSSPKPSWNVLGYAFGPALVCLLAGQVTIFMLFGFVLFLRFHRSRPFAAGSALWLCMLKPHLFLPFGVVLLVWIVVTRNYKVLAGTGAALAVSSLIATGLDRDVWRQYAAMMRVARLDRAQIPSVSVMLRLSVWPHNLVVQCIPVVLGCVWALYFFRKQRSEWTWLEHGSLLILVSVLVAPYTWLMDQALVIPSLLFAVYLTRSRILIGLLALGSAAMEIAALAGLSMLHSWFFIWTSPGWLIWYLLAKRRGRPREAGGPSQRIEPGSACAIENA